MGPERLWLCLGLLGLWTVFPGNSQLRVRVSPHFPQAQNHLQNSDDETPQKEDEVMDELSIYDLDVRGNATTETVNIDFKWVKKRVI